MGETIIKRGDKIGIVACSNSLKESSRPEMEQLKITLESLGLTPVFSEYLYAQNDAESGTRQQRAEALMKFYRDEEIKGIFDVSGGNLANGVLPWLDYEVIAKSGKAFWGYSDLTTVVNAISRRHCRADGFCVKYLFSGSSAGVNHDIFSTSPKIGTFTLSLVYILIPLRASAKATCWGVLTITAPVIAKVCTKVR